MKIIQGDCVEVMRGMEECSVDAVVCDPPYGLEFMGREWDKLISARDETEVTVGRQSTNPFISSRVESYKAGKQAEAWHLQWTREAYRVLKPGGHLLAFGGTRTYHRLACAIEDAGFEIRDSLHWIYSTGFPKAWNFSTQHAGGFCGCEQTTEHDVRQVRKADLQKTKRDGEEQGQVLRPRLPEQGVCEEDGARPAEGFGGTEEPGVEGWQLHRTGEGVQDGKVSAGVQDHGEGERLRLRTPTGHGDGDWQAADEHGEGSPRRPRHPEQQAGKPEALRQPPRTLDGTPFRGRPTCPRCGKLRAEYHGFSTALKPSHEPIVLARKPLVGTVAQNVLTHGTGALNVDGCRISTGDNLSGGGYAKDGSERHDGIENWRYKRDGGAGEYQQPSGRWPPNTVFSHHPDCRQVGVKKVRGGMAHEPNDKPMERSIYGKTGTLGRKRGYAPDGTETVPDFDCHPACPVKALGEMSGESTSPADYTRSVAAEGEWLHRKEAGTIQHGIGDHGTAVRFFPCFKYQAKASTGERNLGLDEDERNNHPTVKPVDLMRWLVRLVTPPCGTVLDPFLGSGTTALACVLEGVECVGIERDEGYVETARKRVAWAEEHVRKYGRPPIDMGTVEAAAREKDEDPRQGSLF